MNVRTADIIDAIALFLLPLGTAVTHSRDISDVITAINEKTQHMHIRALINWSWPVFGLKCLI